MTSLDVFVTLSIDISTKLLHSGNFNELSAQVMKMVKGKLEANGMHLKDEKQGKGQLQQPNDDVSENKVPPCSLEDILGMTETLREEQENLDSLIKQFSNKQSECFDTLKMGIDKNSADIEHLREQILKLKVADSREVPEETIYVKSDEEIERELNVLCAEFTANTSVAIEELPEQSSITMPISNGSNELPNKWKKPFAKQDEPESIPSQEETRQWHISRYNDQFGKPQGSGFDNPNSKFLNHQRENLRKEELKADVELFLKKDRLDAFFADLRDDKYESAKQFNFYNPDEKEVKQIVRNVWAKVLFYNDNDSAYTNCASVLTHYFNALYGKYTDNKTVFKLEINNITSKLFEERCGAFGLCTRKPDYITHSISKQFNQLQRILRFAAELYTVDLFALPAIKWFLLRLQITAPNIEQYASAPCNENAIDLAVLLIGECENKLCDDDTEYLFWATEAIDNINKYFAAKPHISDEEASRNYVSELTNADAKLTSSCSKESGYPIKFNSEKPESDGPKPISAWSRQDYFNAAKKQSVSQHSEENSESVENAEKATSSDELGAAEMDIIDESEESEADKWKKSY